MCSQNVVCGGVHRSVLYNEADRDLKALFITARPFPDDEIKP